MMNKKYKSVFYPLTLS